MYARGEKGHAWRTREKDDARQLNRQRSFRKPVEERPAEMKMLSLAMAALCPERFEKLACAVQSYVQS